MIRFFMRFLIKLAFIFVGLTCSAVAAESSVENKKMNWSFEGFLGTVDRPSAQRGFQVFKQVCASCHSLQYMSFRNLESIGFSPEEVKAIAAEYNIKDGPNEAGDMFERPGRASDHFPSPYANDNAAKAANNHALPPDLSLIIKARVDGANYVYSLLTGYKKAPADFKMSEGLYYNEYFPGHQIAMPQPLNDGQVEYQDGTVASIDQMSQDLVSFLQFVAEPEMEHRKEAGIKILIYLVIFTILFYLAKNRIWARLKNNKE